MDVSLRAARPEDAERCGIICYAAFRNIAEQHNFPPDFPAPEVAVDLMGALLANPQVYAVAAEAGGRVVGSNFLWESAAVAGIGPITVDPAAQNGKVGRALMEKVLARARDQRFASVRLVQAAYHGRSLALYTKLGFDAREPLVNLQGVPVRAEIQGYAVRPATVGDLDACIRLSLRLHGYERSTELRGAIEQGTAMVVEHDGRISGYATAIGFFGHAVGESNEELKALIGAAPAYSGPGFLLPTRNSGLLRWCVERGLRIVQPMTLMSLGLYNEPRGAFLPSILY
jgi:GNAT superfamily N-acetyltransferase